MQPLGQGGGQGWWTGGRRKIAAAPAGEKGHFWEKMRARFLPRPILPLSRYTLCMHSPWWNIYMPPGGTGSLIILLINRHRKIKPKLGLN